MNIIFLCILLLVIFCFSYLIFQKELFSPSVLFSFSYFVSAVCCLYNAALWGVNLDTDTIFLIVLSLLSFIMGELFIRTILRPEKQYISNVEPYYIQIKKSLNMILIFVTIISTYILFNEVKRIASLNMVSWGNLIYNFKINSNSIEGVRISVLASQGNTISKALSYIYIYIFINNIMVKKTKKESMENMINLIPITMAIIQSLLKGVRIQIINMVFVAVFIWFIEVQIRRKWCYHFKIKQILKICVSVMVVCILFYQSKGVVGRIQDDIGVLKYVTTYLGGPINLFDLFIKEGQIYNENVIEALSGLCSSLQKLGFFQDKTIIGICEYRNTITNIPIGNVYGAIRAYYHDYGTIGVIICFFLLSLFLNILYCTVYKKGNKNIYNPSLLIVYSTFVYGNFFLIFSDFVTSKFAFGALFELMYIVIFVRIALHPKVKTKIVFRR